MAAMEPEESSKWQKEDQRRVTGLSENNGFKGERVATGEKPAEPSSEIRICSLFPELVWFSLESVLFTYLY